MDRTIRAFEETQAEWKCPKCLCEHKALKYDGGGTLSPETLYAICVGCGFYDGPFCTADTTPERWMRERELNRRARGGKGRPLSPLIRPA